MFEYNRESKIEILPWYVMTERSLLLYAVGMQLRRDHVIDQYVSDISCRKQHDGVGRLALFSRRFVCVCRPVAVLVPRKVY